jgi:C-terminal processing protease CtpA/Prc
MYASGDVARVRSGRGKARLIIDLRKNGGGDPAMVTLLSSYLFAESTHLTSIYWREDDRTVQFWTHPYVPGPRLATTPVYVLTSSDTFSGAEDLTYNLQQLKRATIVGEVTGGGAHPGGGFAIDQHFEVGIPTGRSISPVSGTNWEGTRITPDIAVEQEESLMVAHIAALKGIVERWADQQSRPMRELREEAENALAALEA